MRKGREGRRKEEREKVKKNWSKKRKIDDDVNEGNKKDSRTKRKDEIARK